MQISSTQLQKELTAAILRGCQRHYDGRLSVDGAASLASEVLTRCGLVPPATIPNPPELEDLPAVAGDSLGGSLANFTLRCLVLLNEEQNGILPNNAHVAVLCDAVRLAREFEKVARMNEDRVDLEHFEKTLTERRRADLPGYLPAVIRERGRDWGKAIRYVSDDRDYANRNELQIMRGGNGDFYISVCPAGQRTMEGVRICTSGGAAFEVPALVSAVCDAYDALYFAERDNSHRGGVRAP